MIKAKKKCHIKKVTAQSCVSGLPSLETFKIAEAKKYYDLMILAAGFEERATAFPKAFSNNGVKSSYVLVGKYNTNQKDNDTNFKEILPLINEISDNLTIVNADKPEDIIRAIESVITNIDTKLSIAFDISSASSPFILSVIGALKTIANDSSLTILYSEAETYKEIENLTESASNSTEKDITEDGVSIVEVNPLFRGYSNDNTNDYVIAFPDLKHITHGKMCCSIF